MEGRPPFAEASAGLVLCSLSERGRPRVKDSLKPLDEIVIVKPRGRLSLREGHEILEAIFAEVRPEPCNVIVDLSGVSEVSSWGLALLCGLAGKLAETGRNLRIACPRPFVKKYLKMFTGPGRTLSFHVSCEEGVRAASLRGRGSSAKAKARPRRPNGGRSV